MRPAFTFDASACTGCKACQAACKDKNNLQTGVLWRRVYEVSGGEWERRGAAWTNTVFAYNVSVACNHCADPACVAACPTGACARGADGVVTIDAATCAGCEYCAWACPYGAPQYARDLGRMTKCDFCRDLLAEGLSPACVSACPMRALDVTQLDDGPVPGAAQPFPLPASSRTEPGIEIRPHAAMRNALPKAVANREEVRPRAARAARGVFVGEWPLVAFTLFAQAAAGAAAIGLVTGTMTVTLLVAIGVLTACGALASLLHLGRPSRSWRAPTRAGVSPLSREIVAFAVFGAAWVGTWILGSAALVVFAVSGLVLIYAMADVYAIEEVPGWTRMRTLAAFAWSALLLGSITVAAASRLAPVWLLGAIAALAIADQVWRRLGLYAAIEQKTM